MSDAPMILLNILKKARGTRIGKALGVKPVYKKLMKKHLRNNPYNFKGFNLFLNPDDETITDSLVYGGYEEHELHLIKKLIKSGDVILDIGANIGLFTVNCALATGATGKVFSFEPEPINFSFLKKNIALNKVNNVVPFQMAVSSSDGECVFYVNPKNKGDHRMFGDKAHTSTITVPMTSIDSALKDLDVKVNIIKMDIQGAEMQALIGMKETLSAADSPCLLIEFWPYGLKISGSDPSRLLALLESYGFKFYMIDESTNKLCQKNVAEILSLANCDKSDDYRFEDYINLLCVKNTDRILNLL